MAWYDEAVFYHIYPLGLTGAPRQNPYGAPEHRLSQLIPWLDHLQALNVNALYIGPLFESQGHGYETTSYTTVDSRLGTNQDLADFVRQAHARGIKVILDGVFNHVGRDFFAFKDLQANREQSAYKDWFCNVNFWGNNSYNDGFSYDNWGGYDLLVKLNHANPAVRQHLLDAVGQWVREFDIDGLRLDVADVLSFDFMRALRAHTRTLKPDFWLMGEVIHGEYNHWVNDQTLHAVTNYTLHKALFSGHNDQNYFEIAHTVKRNLDMGANTPGGLKLYNFVDNHDVDRIASKLNVAANLVPVHILLYTLPGVPSIYYGSEFALPGARTRTSDAELRPALDLATLTNEKNPFCAFVAELGAIRRNHPELSYGNYQELALTTTHYAFARTLGESYVLVAVNNAGQKCTFEVDALGARAYTGLLSGKRYAAAGGRITIELGANSGDILVAEGTGDKAAEAALAQLEAAATRERALEEERRAKAEAARLAQVQAATAAREQAADAPSSGDDATANSDTNPLPWSEPYSAWTIPQLQSGILAKMAANGPVTPQMERSVFENTHHGSLENWIKSFR